MSHVHVHEGLHVSLISLVIHQTACMDVPATAISYFFLILWIYADFWLILLQP